MAERSSSHHSRQEAERRHLQELSPFHLIPYWPTDCGAVLLSFRAGLPFSSLCKHPHRHFQRYISLISFLSSFTLIFSSYQEDSHNNTFTELASVTDFPTAAASLCILGLSPGQASSVSGVVVAHLPLSARLSTALRGLPNSCLSSSDTMATSSPL